MNADFDEFMARLHERTKALADAEGLTVEEYQARLERERIESERAREEESARVFRMVRHQQAGVPKRFSDLILSGKVDETEPVRDARLWFASDSWALVLGGKKGVGKTVAACVALDLFGPAAKFFAARHLVAFHADEALEDARRAGFLVIDDMGDEALTEIGAERLRGLLTDRHAWCRRTVVTTNLNLRGAGGWAERYGERLVDRLREGGAFKGYDGESLRGAK